MFSAGCWNAESIPVPDTPLLPYCRPKLKKFLLSCIYSVRTFEKHVVVQEIQTIISNAIKTSEAFLYLAIHFSTVAHILTGKSLFSIIKMGMTKKVCGTPTLNCCQCVPPNLWQMLQQNLEIMFLNKYEINAQQEHKNNKLWSHNVFFY